MDIKKGTKVQVRDPDGLGTTTAKVVDPGDYWVTVKWLEARWHLTENVMLARKGAVSQVPRTSIV